MPRTSVKTLRTVRGASVSRHLATIVLIVADFTLAIATSPIMGRTCS